MTLGLQVCFDVPSHWQTMSHLSWNLPKPSEAPREAWAA